MEDGLKIKSKLHSMSEDMYKIAKILNEYCEQHKQCEDINDILPLTKHISHLSDNIFCDLEILLNGNNPGETTNELMIE